MGATGLHQYLVSAAARYPDRVAVMEPTGAKITYGELARLSDAARDTLVTLGVQPGDRVGLYLRKSIDTVAAIFGILKTGAAYVPVDPGAPPSRDAYILNNCNVKVAFVESRFDAAFREQSAQLGPMPTILNLPTVGGGEGLRACLNSAPSKPSVTASPGPDGLAYILYTSGSTGKPKGVMISHRNATSFVDWCSEVFRPTCEDRFSSHAPFHFDLSILDIYVSLKHGASLLLIPEEVGKEPAGLAQLIADFKLTVWYSAPSILSLLAQFGKLDTRDYSSLRMVFFAGEVFPLVHLRTVKKLWPHPRYFNLYGPTETNVCNFYELPEQIPDDRSEPMPIGAVCAHLKGRVVDADQREVSRGGEGELCISGESVLMGYWGLPELTAKAFLSDTSDSRWYRTGDLVVEESPGCFKFLGRRDRMVKKRGYRIELGEIEACLYRHTNIREAAVLATTDANGDVKIRAHLASRDGKPISLIALKQFCSEHVPVYMVPDAFQFHPALPKTSTDKVDYQRLKEAG